MFLTTKSQYAVNAMIDLCNSSGMAIKLMTIAVNHNIDLPYLEKIFAMLKACGLVIAIRGPGGGYKLSRPGNEIYIIDIVDAVDEHIKITRCKDSAGGCNNDKDKCKAHATWINLESNIRQYLGSVTLQDMVDGVDINSNFSTIRKLGFKDKEQKCASPS